MVVGEERKKKGEREKQGGRTKARKGRERACKNFFNEPLPSTFGLMRCRKGKTVNLPISWKYSPIACMFSIGPTRLLRFVTFVNLPFSFRSLEFYCCTRIYEGHVILFY